MRLSARYAGSGLAQVGTDKKQSNLEEVKGNPIRGWGGVSNASRKLSTGLWSKLKQAGDVIWLR